MQIRTMQIRTLADKTGLSINTIRFYEKKGLLNEVFIHRKPNGYRDYNDQAIERLLLIQRGKRLGFTLAEIQAFIQAWETNQLTDDQKEALLRQKISVIEEQMQALEQMKVYLLEKIALIRHAPHLLNPVSSRREH